MKIEMIVIHETASPQGRGDNAETIHRWHQGNGWDGIGYHRAYLEDGTVEQGRPPYWTGAHAAGHNKGTLGFVYIGEGGNATTAQLEAMRQDIVEIQAEYPAVEIKGHYELDHNKTCPGFDMDKFREFVETGLLPVRF